MSWLDRLKGKGGDARPEDADRPARPRRFEPRAERPAESPSADDFDALLKDIVTGLAAGAEPAPEPAEARPRRARLEDLIGKAGAEIAPRETRPAPGADEPEPTYAAEPEPVPPEPAPSEPAPTEPAAPMPAPPRARDERSPEALMADAFAAATAGEYETALAIWEPLARKGNARAQNNIGACFVDGLGVEQNLDLARRWLDLSAEGGDPVGRRNLATLFFKGQGVPQDYARAAELYRAAAEGGDGPAQDMLSWMLLEGEVMPPDPVEARRWARAAAEQGIASSMTRLGMIAHNALGMERDPVEAARWWRRGAEAGDADGQAMLGAAHHLGSGVPRDRVAAFAWLLRARAGHSALTDRFFDAVRATLTPDEEAAAHRRAAIPLGEIP